MNAKFFATVLAVILAAAVLFAPNSSVEVHADGFQCPAGSIPLKDGAGNIVECLMTDTTEDVEESSVPLSVPGKQDILDQIFRHVDKDNVEFCLDNVGLTTFEAMEVMTDPDSPYGAFTMVCTDGVSVADPDGMGPVSVDGMGTYACIVVPNPTTFTDRASQEWLYGADRDSRLMGSLSVEPAMNGVELQISAITEDGLVELRDVEVVRTNSVGRMDGFIHLSLWQEEMADPVIAYYVVFSAPQEGVAFRTDQNPDRRVLAIPNVDPFVPSLSRLNG